jgi:hypothetical protein
MLGAVLCIVAFPLLVTEALWSGALGLETLALAFWVWARAAEDAREQVPRWAWLRRPAKALWIAAAAQAPTPAAAHGAREIAELLRLVEAVTLVWAGLELLAALPVARPFSDLPGPLLALRPWLPVVLPGAGFLVLWRHAGSWVGVEPVRSVAVVLLVLTALLGALRAFGRLQWTASLRWLGIAEGSLAALLVAQGAVPPEVSLALWMGACGGRALMLAGELRGATPRRGALLHRLWRLAAWVASASLSWPLLVSLGSGPAERAGALAFVATSMPVALVSWITVRRFVEAPERRQVMRLDPALTASHLGALLTLILGPIALVAAWWSGFEASWPGSVIALAPAVLGGWLGLLGGGVREPVPGLPALERAGARARAAARGAFHGFVAFEGRLVRAVTGVLRALTVPVRDLHTGDPQEYLLLVVAVALLAVLLPFLR